MYTLTLPSHVYYVPSCFIRTLFRVHIRRLCSSLAYFFWYYVCIFGNRISTFDVPTQHRWRGHEGEEGGLSAQDLSCDALP